MKKQLMYYFYFDTFEFLEVYKLHFACINSYNDIFDQYTFIIGVDDIDDKNLIDHWKNIIQSYINSNKKISFFVEKNSKEYRDGIVCYKYLISKLNEFDGLVLWGHSKRDLQLDKDIVYNWITMMHYQNWCMNDHIENTLCSLDNNYCCHGPFLSYKNGSFNKLFYMGGMYWIYPKKVLQLFEKEYIEMINYIELVKYHYDNVDDCHNKTNANIINYFGELWFEYFMKEDNLHSYQISLINATTVEGSNNIYMTFDPYIMSFEDIKDIFENSFYNYMMDWCNYTKEMLNYEEKENTD